MMSVGCHLSVADGYVAMVETAKWLGANTFAFFTRNPRGGSAKRPSQEEIDSFNSATESFAPLVAHGAYTMNLCSDKESVRKKALDMLKDDLGLMENIPGNYYNFHPGSHLYQGIAEGTNFVVEALNSVLCANQSTVVLLETMAGKGSELGRRFEELAGILDRIVYREKVGVCFDTCHVWDAGYDVKGSLDSVLAEFDKVVGLDRLLAVHLNDSLYWCGSRKDRHARLGKGL